MAENWIDVANYYEGLEKGRRYIYTPLKFIKEVIGYLQKRKLVLQQLILEHDNLGN